MPCDYFGPGDSPPEIAALPWEELLKESAPLPEELLERARRLTEGVRVDLDASPPDQFAPSWDVEVLPNDIAPDPGEG
jgi:hypothetical protein